MSKPVLKWSPAHPVRIKDNLISSAAREKNQTGFKPSYESDPKQYMNFLMSDEYKRIWFKERGKYEKDIYSREETIKEESKIKRRVVQRMMTYRRPLKNDFIDDIIQKKKGEAPALDHSLTPEKMKFKPECHRKDKHAKSQPKGQSAAAESESKPKAAEANAAAGKQKTSDGKQKTSEGKQKSAPKGKEAKDEKQKEHREAKKDEEDDECDGSDAGGEVLLVCADTANVECNCEGDGEGAENKK